MPNYSKNGFRWVGSKYAPTATEPPIMILPVATGYATAIPRGYPVKLISDGTIEVCAETDTVYGISDGVAQYYDGSFVRKGTALPAATAYSTNLSRQSLLRIIPVPGQLFRANCDENTTATTLASYIAFVGENVEWDAGTAVGDEAGCVLDISTHATTATSAFVWRIENIPDRELQDFTATGVSLVVSCNLPQTTAGGSTTGT